MDLFIVTVLFLFSVFIYVLIRVSGVGSSSSSRSLHGIGVGAGVGGFNLSGEALVEAQLEELMVTHGMPSPEGSKAFKCAWKEKKLYEEMKRKNGVDPKLLQAQLLKRSIELCVTSDNFSKKVTIVNDSYNHQVPRDIIEYLNGLNGELSEEVALVKKEADELRPGWGSMILAQAMEMSVGVARKKEARAAEEARMAAEARAAAKAKEAQLKAAEEAEAKRKREADRAFQELMKMSEKEGGGGGGGKKKNKNKSDSQKK